MKNDRILIVDDSPAMRQTIVRALSLAGYSTLEASDGQDALDRIKDGEPIALALVDVNMPRLDGISLVRELRAMPHTRSIPILMVATEPRRERREEARQAGATGWILKPFRPESLVSRVRELLSH